MQAVPGYPSHYLITESRGIRWELWLRDRPRIVQVSSVDQRVTGAYWCYADLRTAVANANRLDGDVSPSGWVSQGGAALTPDPA